MIRCHLLDGKFEERILEDFSEISKVVDSNRKKIYGLELDVIIQLLTKLGRKVIKDGTINTIEGVSYISLWLRKDNLKKICSLNYLDQSYYEDFKRTESNFELCAQPRGIVCHWVASNVPTLAFFSLIQSILSRNGSIVKVPEENVSIILTIMKHLNEITVDMNGKTYSGKDIVDSVAIVSFDGKSYEVSKKFSLIADCKIIWGGSDAIAAVTALPQKEHCELISFGPKYSFGVFDREFIESDYFEKALENSVTDIVMFNQMACSSPHVLFFEKSRYSIREIAEKMKTYFEKLPDRFLSQYIPQGTATKIINVRGRYLLEDDRGILKSDGLGWTILINNDFSLEEPVQGKCIFIKEMDDIDKVVGLITRKVQAMIVCILNPDKKREFAKKATFNGVDRIVIPGKIHDFDLPWDGILPLNRLVRWVILKNGQKGD